MARAETKGRTLIVDDESDTCATLEDALSHFGFETASRTSVDAALSLLEMERFDIVLSDLSMQGKGGLDLCRTTTASHPDVPVVIMSAFGNMEAAIQAIRAGAYDFVTKPFELEDIAMTLDRAVAHRRLHEEVRRLRSLAHEDRDPAEMIGSGGAMKAVSDLVSRIADTEASILITGESGTGKEVVARAIHARSRRRAGPFVAINCAAMPEPLLESELFGHEKGAFTDARQARAGLFVEADGGTLLLDEIGEMPLGMQAKLLRALQERTVRRVGGNTEVPFDARILAATNRDLEADVAARRFREDLYYRVNVVGVPVPPLRARGTDVLDLAHAFIARYAAIHKARVKGLTDPAAERLLAYAWPGNVRELQNCIERAVALAHYELLGVDDLPEKLRQRTLPGAVHSDDPGDLRPFSEVERDYVLHVLGAMRGNKTATATVLGFDRRTLYRKLARYGALEEGIGEEAP